MVFYHVSKLSLRESQGPGLLLIHTKPVSGRSEQMTAATICAGGYIRFGRAEPFVNFYLEVVYNYATVTAAVYQVLIINTTDGD